jgi:hypothetical protein
LSVVDRDPPVVFLNSRRRQMEPQRDQREQRALSTIDLFLCSLCSLCGSALEFGSAAGER